MVTKTNKSEDKGVFYKTLEAIEDHWVVCLIGAAVLYSVGEGISKTYIAHEKAQVEQAKVRAGLELKVGDYNGNNILDTYYEINGQKVPVEVDGKPVAEYFKK